MTDLAVWPKLEKQFLECQEACDDGLEAFNWDWPALGYRWAVVGGGQLVRDRFTALAEKASIELGYKGANVRDFWLDLLKHYSSNWSPIQLTSADDRKPEERVTSGCVRRLCSASAYLCLVCENMMRTGRLSDFIGQILANTHQERRPAKVKPGPKTDLAMCQQVVNIVQSIASNENWKSRLDEICTALDQSDVPVPKSWRRKRVQTWSEYEERQLAEKAISYRLQRVARKELGTLS